MKEKKAIQVLSFLVTGGLLAAQLACTQTIILFKPSPIIDPMPERGSLSSEEKPDPMFDEQWSLHKIGLDRATIRTQDFAGNANVKIAILSTGIDYNHEDLVGQVAINRAEISRGGAGDSPGVNRVDDDKDGFVDNVVGWDVVDGDGFAFDRHGAGTAVAGIIAARQGNGVGIAGLMRNVTLYPVRYIDDNGQTSVANLVSALDVAVKSNADVVFIQSTELELGGRRQKQEVVNVEIALMERHLNKLRDKKVPVVVGAGDDLGNFASTEMQKLLRRYENVIVVTSSDSSDAIPLLSNTDFEGVTTMAPGEEILTTKPGNRYGTVSGTAYAAAHVTAALALAKAQFGNRYTYEDYSPVLVSARGGDVVRNAERFSRGGNRLNVQKFLSALRTR